ncbi:hypothetical protein [Treponema sp. R80B11-R83G3]
MKNTKNKCAKRRSFLTIVVLAAVIGFVALSLTGCMVMEIEKEPAILKNANKLTQGVWTVGNIPTENDEEWFTFKATAAAQYIHFEPGTMVIGKMQLYNNDAETKRGNIKALMGVNSYPLTLTAGNIYYIKITGTPTTDLNAEITGRCGTFKIAFSSNVPPAITPPPNNVTQIPGNKWINGNISSAPGEQWFKFTATANTCYIYFEPDTMSSLNVRLYDSNWTQIGEEETLSAASSPISKTDISEGEYYIRVYTGFSETGGTYKIGVTDSTTPPAITLPTENVTSLNTAGTWVSGSIDEDGEQWFSFTAAASTQFIHFKPGTLNDVYIQLYDNTGILAGNRIRLNSSTLYIPRTVTMNQKYYIKVTPFSSSGSGAYQITFGNSFTFETVTELTEKVWADGSIANPDSEQWFKFTATADTQYIYITRAASTILKVQLYNNIGIKAGGSENLNSSLPSISRPVTNNQEYYINVSFMYNVASGPYPYQIAFSSLDTMPVPTANVTELTEDQWANGNIASQLTGEQWFKFTATADTQYIHFNHGSITTSIDVQLYDPDGAAIGDSITLGSGATFLSPPISVTETSEYYIKVIISYTSGQDPIAYKIGFNTSTTPPSS